MNFKHIPERIQIPAGWSRTLLNCTGTSESYAFNGVAIEALASGLWAVATDASNLAAVQVGTKPKGLRAPESVILTGKAFRDRLPKPRGQRDYGGWLDLSNLRPAEIVEGTFPKWQDSLPAPGDAKNWPVQFVLTTSEDAKADILLDSPGPHPWCLNLSRLEKFAPLLQHVGIDKLEFRKAIPGPRVYAIAVAFPPSGKLGIMPVKLRPDWKGPEV